MVKYVKLFLKVNKNKRDNRIMDSSTQNRGGGMEDRIVLFQYPLNFCILFWEQSVKKS